MNARAPAQASKQAIEKVNKYSTCSKSSVCILMTQNARSSSKFNVCCTYIHTRRDTKNFLAFCPIAARYVYMHKMPIFARNNNNNKNCTENHVFSL